MTWLKLAPFAAVSVALAAISNLQDDMATFEPLVRALAELPLVAGAVWLVIRLQEKQQTTLASLMSHFADRAEAKDKFYQQLLKDQNDLIEELAKYRFERRDS